MLAISSIAASPRFAKEMPEGRTPEQYSIGHVVYRIGKLPEDRLHVQNARKCLAGILKGVEGLKDGSLAPTEIERAGSRGFSAKGLFNMNNRHWEYTLLANPSGQLNRLAIRSVEDKWSWIPNLSVSFQKVGSVSQYDFHDNSAFIWRHTTRGNEKLAPLMKRKLEPVLHAMIPKIQLPPDLPALHF